MKSFSFLRGVCAFTAVFAMMSVMTSGAYAAGQCSVLNDIGTDTAGTKFVYVANDGTLSDGARDYGFTASDKNAFAVDYGSKGVISGFGRCSKDGTNASVDTLTDETGVSGARYCYCDLNYYTPVSGSSDSITANWMRLADLEDEGACAANCSARCGTAFNTVDDAFRSAFINSATCNVEQSGGGVATSEHTGTSTTIQIATTKYNENGFAPVENDLATVRGRISSIVENIISQASSINNLAVTRQNRPNSYCPDGKQCLLIRDRNGNDNWYIIEDCGVIGGISAMGAAKVYGTSGYTGGTGPSGKLCATSGINCASGEWVSSYDKGLMYGVAKRARIAQRNPGDIVSLANENAASDGNVCLCKATGWRAYANGAYASSRTPISTDRWMVAGVLSGQSTDDTCLALCMQDGQSATALHDNFISYYANISNTCMAAAAMAQMCVYNQFYDELYTYTQNNNLTELGVNNHGTAGLRVYGSCDTGGTYRGAEPCATDSANPGAWVLPVANSGTYSGAVMYGKSRCVENAAVFSGVADYSIVTVDSSLVPASNTGTVCLHNVTGYKAAGSNAYTSVSADAKNIWMVKQYADATECSNNCFGEGWPENYLRHNFDLYGAVGDSCRAN